MTLKKVMFAAAVVVAISCGTLLGHKPPAPVVTLHTLKGSTLSLAELRGKVVMLNFWATTCSTCVGEMPAMTATWRQFAPRGYEMVAVAMDYDRPDWVLNFASANGLPFMVALDLNGEVARAFGGVRLTPTSFLIDRRGRIVQQYLGAPDFAKLNALVANLLSEPA